MKVGTEEILYFSASSLWSSMSILTNVVASNSLLIFSKTGAIFLQGGHQVAVKYNTLLPSDLMISSSLLDSPNTTYFEANLAELLRKKTFLQMKDLASIFEQ